MMSKSKRDQFVVIEPQYKSLLKLIIGLGRGLWGKGEEYIEKDRNKWRDQDFYNQRGKTGKTKNRIS